MAKKCALLSNNVIVNTIIVEDIEQSSKDLNAVLVEIPEGVQAGCGWIYDETTGIFSLPE